MSLVEVDKCTVDKSGVTHVKVQEFGSYTWTIVNFKFGVFLKCQRCYSPVFRTGPNNEFEWQLCVRRSDYSNYFSLTLSHKNLAPATTKATGNGGRRGYLILVLLNKWGKEDITTELIVDVQLDEAGEKQASTTFIKREHVFDEANGLMPNGHLTIRCKMYYDDGVVSYARHCQRLVPSTQAVGGKNDDMERLLESERFADVELVCGETVVRAHRAILAARSDVFAAMFESGMREEIEGRVSMHEMDLEIVKDLLRFIYSGKVRHLEERTRELLAAANMYALHELKSMCEELLIERMSHDNVGLMLHLADKYRAENLKDAAIEYLTLHAKDIVNTESFQADVKQWSPLLLELLMKLFALKAI